MKKVRWMLSVHQNLVLLLLWFVVQQWCVDDEGPLRITDTDYCIGSLSQRSLALVPRQFSKPTWTTPNSQAQKFTYRQVLFTLTHQIRFLCPNAWIRTTCHLGWALQLSQGGPLKVIMSSHEDTTETEKNSEEREQTLQYNHSQTFFFLLCF